MKVFPYTFEMDYSNYDATQCEFLRTVVDKYFGKRLRDKGIIRGDVDLN